MGKMKPRYHFFHMFDYASAIRKSAVIMSTGARPSRDLRSKQKSFHPRQKRRLVHWQTVLPELARYPAPG